MKTFARRAIGCAAALTALFVASCGASTTNGNGSVVPSLTGQPSSAAPSSAGDFPSVSATGTTTTGACPTGAFCDDFSDKSSGWQTENEPHYFAQYDPFHGGTYRIGERTSATVSEVAPLDIPEISNDYSVQIDVDATFADTMPTESTSGGVDCWEHTAKDGHSTAAFIFFVGGTDASIGLWDDEDGSYHNLTTQPLSVVHTDGTPNHISITCVQSTSGGAELAVTVNGTTAAATTYAHSTSTYAWAVGPKAGLLASGKGSDIFYDNFVVKCAGDSC